MFRIFPRSAIVELTDSRIINISGKVGSGKTLLAVALAYTLWREGLVDHIITSFPMVGRTLDYEGVTRRFVMIADELGKIMDSRQYSRNKPQDFVNDIRKKDGYFITASKTPVDKWVRDIEVQRIRPSFGNWLWRYQWITEEGIGVVHGEFWLYNPKFLFGLYPTKYMVKPQELEDLRKFMLSTMPDEERGFYEEYGHKYTVEDGIQVLDGFNESNFIRSKLIHKKTVGQQIGSIIRKE